VLALADAGAEAIAADRPEARFDELLGRSSRRTLRFDLSHAGAVKELAAEATAVCGRIDVLVNCAGVGLHRGVAELGPGENERVLAVNLAAPIELTRILLPGMLERGRGHVVNVGSVVGFLARPNEAVYAASKAALAAFTESLRAETRPRGVSASLVAPVAVDTAFFAERGVPYGRRWPRLLPPERIAGAVLAAIRSDRAQVFVPRWIGLAVGLHALSPGLYRNLATTFD